MTDDRTHDRTHPDAAAPDGGPAPRDAATEPWLREILRCPACGSPLRDGTRPDGAPELVCTGETCALAYPIRDGIPVLLVEEGYPSSGTV